MSMNDLIVFALQSEAPSLFQYQNVFQIGVGKVNAAMNTALLISKFKPKRVINLGTSGGVTLDKGIYRVRHILQHDVNLIALGIKPGQMLNDLTSFIDLGGEGYTCATGDMHVHEKHKLRVKCDLVDMESYAIAKVCLTTGIECHIYKYVSDLADENAGTTWKEHVAAGEVLYKNILEELKVELIGG